MIKRIWSVGSQNINPSTQQKGFHDPGSCRDSVMVLHGNGEVEQEINGMRRQGIVNLNEGRQFRNRRENAPGWPSLSKSSKAEKKWFSSTCSRSWPNTNSCSCVSKTAGAKLEGQISEPANKQIGSAEDPIGQRLDAEVLLVEVVLLASLTVTSHFA